MPSLGASAILVFAMRSSGICSRQALFCIVFFCSVLAKLHVEFTLNIRQRLLKADEGSRGQCWTCTRPQETHIRTHTTAGAKRFCSSRSIRHPQCYPLGTLTVPIRCIDELLDFQPPVYGEEPVQMLPDDKSWEWAAKKGAVVLRLLGVQWHPAIMAAMATPLA